MDDKFVNADKSLTITVEDIEYERIAVKTDIFKSGDDIVELIAQYAGDTVRPDDLVFISEKAVSCTQGRFRKMEDIKVSGLARFLVKFVTKSPHGIGISRPESMQMAIEEGGALRILFAAFVGAVGKLFRQKGWFYLVAGPRVRNIDFPVDDGVPTFTNTVILSAIDPHGVSKKIAERLGCKVAVVDANDLGCNVMGWSDNVDNVDKIPALLKDNPLGQADEQTPFGIIRKAEKK